MKKIVVLTAGLFLFFAAKAQTFAENHNSRDGISANKNLDSIKRLMIVTDTAIKKPSPKKPVRQTAIHATNKMEARKND